MPKLTDDNKYPVVAPQLTDKAIIDSDGVIKKSLISSLISPIDSTVDPGRSDTGYFIGKIWRNMVNRTLWMLADVAGGYAEWRQFAFQEHRPTQFFQTNPPYKYESSKYAVYSITAKISGFTHNCKDIVFDGKYIYVANYGKQIIRFDPADFDGTWKEIGSAADSVIESGIPGVWDWKNILYDGGKYIWAVAETNSYITLCRYNILTEVWTAFQQSKTGTIILGLGMDGDGNFWTADEGTNYHFWRFNRSAETFSEFTIAESIKGRDFCFDGKNIWMGMFEPNEYIYKIDPSDGSYTAIATGTGNAGTENLCFDGMFVWMLHDTAPTRISRINPVSHAIDTYTLAAGNQDPRSIFYDGKSIWIGQKPYDHVLVQFDPLTQEYVVYDTGVADHKQTYSLGSDGKNIWLGLRGSSAMYAARMPRIR